jgi:hypothetical protein
MPAIVALVASNFREERAHTGSSRPPVRRLQRDR